MKIGGGWNQEVWIIEYLIIPKALSKCALWDFTVVVMIESSVMLNNVNMSNCAQMFSDHMLGAV